MSLHVAQNKVYTDNHCHESLCKVTVEILLFVIEIHALETCRFHVKTSQQFYRKSVSLSSCVKKQFLNFPKTIWESICWWFIIDLDTV